MSAEIMSGYRSVQVQACSRNFEISRRVSGGRMSSGEERGCFFCFLGGDSFRTLLGAGAGGGEGD